MLSNLVGRLALALRLTVVEPGMIAMEGMNAPDYSCGRCDARLGNRERLVAKPRRGKPISYPVVYRRRVPHGYSCRRHKPVTEGSLCVPPGLALWTLRLRLAPGLRLGRLAARLASPSLLAPPSVAPALLVIACRRKNSVDDCDSRYRREPAIS